MKFVYAYIFECLDDSFWLSQINILSISTKDYPNADLTISSVKSFTLKVLSNYMDLNNVISSKTNNRKLKEK